MFSALLSSSIPNILAGMPSLLPSDLMIMRAEALSFFLVAYFLCGWIIQKIWNALAKDWTWMPKLTYWRAMGVVVITGLFCYVILTMISGARELMTPGAWKREGVLYKLQP